MMPPPCADLADLPRPRPKPFSSRKFAYASFLLASFCEAPGLAPAGMSSTENPKPKYPGASSLVTLCADDAREEVSGVRLGVRVAQQLSLFKVGNPSGAGVGAPAAAAAAIAISECAVRSVSNRSSRASSGEATL